MDSAHRLAVPRQTPRGNGNSASDAALDAELRRWSAGRIATVAALWVLGAVALVLLSFAAHQFHEFPGDLGIEEWVQQVHQQVLVRFINFASDANWPTPAGIIAIVVIVALAVTRHVRAAIAAAVAGFGADLANVLVNGLVRRPRPNDMHIHAVAHLGLYSYPSGHVTHVIAFYGFLLYLSIGALRRYRAWRPAIRVVQVICVYFIVFIGPSRVLEGEHWPSDVVAGYLLGALMLVVGIAVYHALGLAWLRLHRHRAASPAAGDPHAINWTTPLSV